MPLCGGKHLVLRFNYRPDIDAMRGIAVLAVFIYHLNEAWLPGGFTGVDVFFVISGYVVTGSLLGHQGEGPWQQLAGFYVRRIRRLLPNLLASVGVTSLGIALLVPPSETRSLFVDAVKALYGWSNNRFAAKATDYFGLDSNLNPLSHTWSLGVEEQFYLIFPLLLLLIGVGRRRALPILLGLSLASLGLSLWWTQEAPILAFFLMPSRFWELSAGAVLLLAQLRGFGGHLNRLWLRLGGYGLMLLALLKTSAQQWFPAPGALVAVLATLLLLQAGYGATSERFLPWRGLERFLVACGLISYSLYLWHWPVLTFLRWTYGIDRFWLYSLAIGLSFGLAWLAYVLVEQPVRRRPLSAPFQWGLSLAALAVTWTGIDALAHTYRGKFFLGSGVDPVPKLEKIVPQIKKLIAAGIPVMGHLGLTPQSVHALGGFKVQGRGESGEQILKDAKALETAGVFAIVLEAIPAALAAEITKSISVPTIGIGAGGGCDAQVLVWTDLVGITEKLPKLAKAYRNLRKEIAGAASEFARDVANGDFPTKDQSFS